MGKKSDSLKKWANSETAGKPATRKTKKSTKSDLGSDRVTKPTTTRSTAKKTAAAPVFSHISREEIALRAYFIAEKRHRDGLPGNEHLDWLEAEKQLQAERKPKRKKAATA